MGQHRESSQASNTSLGATGQSRNTNSLEVAGLDMGPNMCASLDRGMLMPMNRKRAPTRENRAKTLNLTQDLAPEYKLVEKHNILSVSGECELCECVE